MRPTILASLLLAFLPGCFISRADTNRSIDAQALASLQPQGSTAADVVRALGAPTEVVQLAARTAYRYDHTVQKQAGLFLLLIGLRGIDTQADRVWVFFDEHDVLTHIGATLDASDAEYDLPGL
jgi:outer membrane protein assembly factor BamE (lipoprotein component of BamABCDE complex)